ncbi:YrzA family protein [Niallia sp. NCCP-28]|uniref:YrzA family protein n=1 Tax=Niallia sp. NCCP-28 TaxID=2934712 RepID=UPI002086501A|nr:YrzA family protein [Niallia sp. NCCP-28]GKU81365.1 hypothetical protein NCCP28_07610 [Niallia sp. NCCP-28]
MDFHLDIIEDKIEFFEADNLKTLEKKITEQIDINKGIFLGVHSVSHQMAISDNGRPYFTAVVHFKAKNR